MLLQAPNVLLSPNRGGNPVAFLPGRGGLSLTLFLPYLCGWEESSWAGWGTPLAVGRQQQSLGAGRGRIVHPPACWHYYASSSRSACSYVRWLLLFPPLAVLGFLPPTFQNMQARGSLPAGVSMGHVACRANPGRGISGGRWAGESPCPRLSPWGCGVGRKYCYLIYFYDSLSGP